MRFQQRIGKVKEFADDCCGHDACASLLEGCEAYASSGIYRSMQGLRYPIAICFPPVKMNVLPCGQETRCPS